MRAVFLSCMLCWLCFGSSGCYSFSGTDIDYAKIKTFTVLQFETQAPNAPPALGQIFSERLRDQVRNNTRLTYRASGGDVQFSGSITQYTITAVAPKPGETTALQQLMVGVSVSYANKQQGQEWTQSFSYPATYETGQDFAALQDQLVNEAFDNLLDNIFNKAFSNW
jgi:hypothetical protein